MKYGDLTINLERAQAQHVALSSVFGDKSVYEATIPFWSLLRQTLGDTPKLDAVINALRRSVPGDLDPGAVRYMVNAVVAVAVDELKGKMQPNQAFFTLTKYVQSKGLRSVFS